MYYTTLTLDYIDWFSYDHVWNSNIATLDITKNRDITSSTLEYPATLYYSINNNNNNIL